MNIIAHIDMNSYFASVEQQANPLLRGKPVGVCAYLGENGCIIASSKEAKGFGIKTGCPVWRARQLHPGIVLIENEPAKYRSTTEMISNIFAEYTDVIEQYSIDESFLDLTGYVKSFAEADALVAKIRERIKNEVGEWLTCSAGISWTRWLAKFASDYAKSNTQLVLADMNACERVYDDCILTDAWGIGDAMKGRLNALRIFTLRDLQKYPVANIMRILGKQGYYLWAHVNGVEVESVQDSSQVLPKSIGHTYCIPYQTNDKTYLSSILMKLVDRAGRRLRGLNMEAYNVTAGYSLVSGGGHFKTKKLSEPVYTTDEIYSAASRLFFEYEIPSRVRMVAVSVSSLRPVVNQCSLFDTGKNRNLSNALDKIYDRYGENTVYKGRMWGTEGQAVDRIGYRKLH